MPNNDDGTPSMEGADATQGTYTPTYPPNDWQTRSHQAEFDWSLVRSNYTKPIGERWFASSWRPLAAYMYLAICFFDFMIAPILTMLISGVVLPWFKGSGTYVPWHPLTLEGGGLFHVSMGAILGIYTWGRTKEKIDPKVDDTIG
jgi:hypothetical protein